MAFGVGEIAPSRGGDPADRARYIHTVRGVGAVSKAVAAAAEWLTGGCARGTGGRHAGTTLARHAPSVTPVTWRDA